MLIDAVNGHGDSNERLHRLSIGRGLFTSTVNLFELERGARTSEQLSVIRNFLGFFTILPLDSRCAAEAAVIDIELRRQGLRIDPRDTLIAGIARAHSMELVTGNRRHFDRIPNLIVSEL